MDSFFSGWLGLKKKRTFGELVKRENRVVKRSLTFFEKLGRMDERVVKGRLDLECTFDDCFKCGVQCGITFCLEK